MCLRSTVTIFVKCPSTARVHSGVPVQHQQRLQHRGLPRRHPQTPLQEEAVLSHAEDVPPILPLCMSGLVRKYEEKQKNNDLF